MCAKRQNRLVDPTGLALHLRVAVGLKWELAQKDHANKCQEVVLDIGRLDSKLFTDVNVSSEKV